MRQSLARVLDHPHGSWGAIKMADTSEDAVFRLNPQRTANRSRTELIDDMALPFLDLAERIEAARLNDADAESWRAILETNLFLWWFISNFLPRNFSEEVSTETVNLLEKISLFMTKVSVAVPEDGSYDSEVIDKVVQLNLNMCDQILALRGTVDR